MVGGGLGKASCEGDRIVRTAFDGLLPEAGGRGRCRSSPTEHPPGPSYVRRPEIAG
jgi:hypothetical protein